MRDTALNIAVDEVVALKMKAVDDYIEKNVVPILDSLGNPEKLIGKTWKEWTPQDKQILSSIYGAALEDFIAKKAIAEMREAEAEVM